jgi:transaldolase
LWASTGTKNPAYSDVLYVESLIGGQTINTLPDATLAAFREHGHVASTLTTGMSDAQAHIKALAALGIDLMDVGETLQTEGVRIFAEAYEKLLAAVQ